MHTGNVVLQNNLPETESTLGLMVDLRYDHRMGAWSLKLKMLLCICLLAMQVSGLHLHASVDGIGDLHGTHIHELDAAGHGHEGDSDVSFLESVTGWVKPLPFLVLFISALFTCVVIGTHYWSATTKTFQASRYSRWRPPLRAPPQFVS